MKNKQGPIICKPMHKEMMHCLRKCRNPFLKKEKEFSRQTVTALVFLELMQMYILSTNSCKTICVVLYELSEA